MLINSDFKKVFITGYYGFTGKILAARLAKDNYQVIGHDYKGDICDYENLLAYINKTKPDFIIHLAAISTVVNQDEEKLYKINLFGALNILRALKETQIRPRKVIFASSAYVYGINPQRYIAETAYPRPINHYGSSKLAMEYMIATWFDEFPIIITRPFNYTGLGQSLAFLLPKIIKNFQEKRSFIELGNIDVTREIFHVDFVTEIYLRLLESNIHSEIINICSGVGYTITDILEIMNEISGHKPEVKINPEFCRKNEIHRLVGCNKKLIESVGNIPIMPLRKTLSEMYYSE
jgi:GDP-6-deoxy-D-talose 4-dehydrogenase